MYNIHKSPTFYFPRKWFPLQGERTHSLYFWSFQKQNREEGGGTEQQTYQFIQGYNILHRLQVHHLILTFIIHNKYISTLYLYTYIHIWIVLDNYINDNAFY